MRDLDKSDAHLNEVQQGTKEVGNWQVGDEMVSSGESKEMVNKKIEKVLKCSKCSFKTSITKNKSKSRKTIKKHEAACEGDQTSYVMGAKVDQDADKIVAVTIDTGNKTLKQVLIDKFLGHVPVELLIDRECSIC